MKAQGRIPFSDRIAAITLCALCCTFFVLAAGCSDDKSTAPDKKLERLAGGGRGDSDDPFVGGPGDSGPNDSLPGVPGDPTQGIYPIYMSQFTPWQQEPYQVIDNNEDWVAWWDTAMAYSEARPAPTIPIPGDSVVSDTDWVPTMPEVDFEFSVVVVIRLADGIHGRYMHITGVETHSEGSMIQYEVLTPGDDCTVPAVVSSPVGAFIVPRPLPSPHQFTMDEIVYDCYWEPDPNEPFTVYYSDAACPELGGGEIIIRSEEEWDAWTDQAWTCDMERWGNWQDSLIIWPDSGVVPPMEPPDMSWLLDFSTHAVVVLRADENTRWGGGIWLNRFEVTSSGTIIEYTDVRPEGECPATEGGVIVRPTVAIRVPLPLTEPIQWIRNVETVDCNWGEEPIVGP